MQLTTASNAVSATARAAAPQPEAFHGGVYCQDVGEAGVSAPHIDLKPIVESGKTSGQRPNVTNNTTVVQVNVRKGYARCQCTDIAQRVTK